MALHLQLFIHQASVEQRHSLLQELERLELLVHLLILLDLQLATLLFLQPLRMELIIYHLQRQFI